MEENNNVYMRIYDANSVALTNYTKYTKSRWNRIIEITGGIPVPIIDQDYISTYDTPYGRAKCICYALKNTRSKYIGCSVSVFILINSES